MYGVKGHCSFPMVAVSEFFRVVEKAGSGFINLNIGTPPSAPLHFTSSGDVRLVGGVGGRVEKQEMGEKRFH